MNTASLEELLALRLSRRLVEALIAERGLRPFPSPDDMMLRMTYRLGDFYVLLEELRARASVLSL